MDQIKNIVSQVMGQMNVTSAQDAGNIQAAWAKIAGTSGSRVADFKDGCLTICTDNSMRMVKFHLNRQGLLQKLEREIPSIKKLSFKVGPV